MTHLSQILLNQRSYLFLSSRDSLQHGKDKNTNTELRRPTQCCYEAESMNIYAWLPHTGIAADVN